jgi:hypothetical protein
MRGAELREGWATKSSVISWGSCGDGLHSGRWGLSFSPARGRAGSNGDGKSKRCGAGNGEDADGKKIS